MKSQIIIILFLSATLFSSQNARIALPGSAAPEFLIETHNSIKVTNRNFKNKFYAFIFEGRGGDNKNMHVRRRIVSFIRMLPLAKRKKIRFFAVADVSGYISLIRGIIRSKIRSNQKKQKIMIYCDWEAHILERFGLVSNGTNFVLVDNKGIIRFKIRGIVSRVKLARIMKYLVDKFKVPYVSAPIDISAAHGSGAY